MALRILYADANIPEKKVADTERGLMPEEQLTQGQALQQVVESLEAVGHDVTVARTFKDAIEKTARDFDVAVIELSWDADTALQPGARRFAGWDICREIDKANKRKSKKTLKVICSERLAEDAAISETAAARYILPIYNQYNKVTAQMLRAAIRFIESGLSNPPAVELALENLRESRENSNRLLDRALADYRQWSILTLVSVFLSIVVLLAGIIGAFSGNVQAGTVTSVFTE